MKAYIMYQMALVVFKNDIIQALFIMLGTEIVLITKMSEIAALAAAI